MLGRFAARTLPLRGPGRSDVAPAMEKWWIKHKPTDGQVTRSLSPYEQQAVMPWLRDFPKIAYKKFSGSFAWWGGSAFLTYATIAGTDAASDNADFQHRF